MKCKIGFLLLLILSHSLYATEPSWKPNPWLSGTLGAVVPGAGYLYNGDSDKAFLALPLTAGMFLPNFVRWKSNTGRSFNQAAFVLSRNIYGFSVYDSFQDALDRNGRPELLVNLPHYTAGQLFSAPLKMKNYSSPKVWIPLGILGGIAVLGVAAKHIRDKPHIDAEKVLYGIPAILLMTLLVGPGEEADFRGFYFPAFSEATGSTYVGGVLQAGLFGYMHTSWPLTGFPMISGGVFNDAIHTKSPTIAGGDLFKFIATFIGGLHHAWITASEEDGLLKSAAFHAAWDFIALTTGLLVNNEAPPVVFSINF